MLIDVTRLVDRRLKGRLATGVDRVSLEYVRHFYDRARALVRHAGRWVILGYTDSRRLFSALLSDASGFGWTARWCVGKAHIFNNCPVRGSLLLNTGHSGLDESQYATEIVRREFEPVFFLHDLIPITHPQYCRAGEEVRHHQRLETMLRMGKGLIVNSHHTDRELKTYAKTMGYGMPRCVVAPLAPAQFSKYNAEPPIDVPYFVMLGTIEPRKNHALMIEVWRQVVQSGLTVPPRLIVIGQQGWDVAPLMQTLRQGGRLGGLIMLRERVRDDELASWLSHARALLFPSLTEGFGLPLVEALSAGTPALASDLPVFRELAGDIPDYLDPRDVVGWTSAVIDYAQTNSPLRMAQLDRMWRFHPNTWDRHFVVVDSFINSIV